MGSIGIQESGSIKDWLDYGDSSVPTRKFKFDKTRPVEHLTEEDERTILTQLSGAKTNSDYNNLTEQVNKLFDKNLLKPDFNKVKQLLKRVQEAKRDKLSK